MRSISLRGWVAVAAVLGLGAAPQGISLSGQIGTTLVIPLGDDAASVGFGGSETAPDPQRGEVVYSLHAPALPQPVDLVTEATFLVTPSEKSRLFDDPVSARLYRGKVVSIVRIPNDQGLVPGVTYRVEADVVRGAQVTPLDFSGTLALLPEKVAILRPDARLVEVGGGRAPRDRWLSSWLPWKADAAAPAGMDLAVSVPRPALQLQWSWSGGPRFEGVPLKLNEGPNRIFGVELSVRYPARQIDIVRVVAPAGRDLVIWHQDDGAGELAIQATSHDQMSIDHLEVVFELEGDRPLDPADRIDGVEFSITKAVDPMGAPVDGGAPNPWSLQLSDVTVR